MKNFISLKSYYIGKEQFFIYNLKVSMNYRH